MIAKENHQLKSFRNSGTGWNEPSLLTKKSASGINLRLEKDSPFNEVCCQISIFRLFLYAKNLY